MPDLNPGAAEKENISYSVLVPSTFLFDFGIYLGFCDLCLRVRLVRIFSYMADFYIEHLQIDLNTYT